MRSIFCTDGYTLTGTVPEVPDDQLPGLRFTYRPCPGPRRKTYLATAPQKEKEAAASLFLDHVEGQTVRILETKDGKPVLGEPMILQAEQFNDLLPYYWTGILNIILGFEGPDLAAAEKN